MQSLAPDFRVTRNDANREIHWVAIGLWTEQTLADLQAKLIQMAKPYLEDRQGFRVLGDLRELAVQSREMAEKIRQSQEASAQLGVERMAFVYSSVLVKQQFRRLSAALEIEFFDNKADAINWLRG
ncbi:MAG: STAS/SEC14 domain-containing protein [Erythrobacter sp.]|uniref:STAS/SEC14 domain-containing protein n=1 Tax=Erythrobacter sp. Alg231-14 TaxID=1922225 RepID=UPI000D55C156